MEISQLRRYWPAVLVALIGTAASLAAFQILRRSAEDNFTAALTAQAETRARGLQEVLSRYEGTIEGFAASFPYARIDREEFQAYAHNVFLASHFLRSGFQSLAWLPRVHEADRERFEAAAHIEGFPDYRIVEPAPDGTFKTAAKRKTYYPIRYIEPVEATSPLGLDVLSEGTRATAARRALEKGTPSATAPVRFFAGGTGCLIYVPVFKSAATAVSVRTEDDHPVGILAFRLFISPTIDAIVEALEPVPQGLDMYVVDDGAPLGERMVYFRPARKTSFLAQLPDESAALVEPFFGSSFNFAGRDWTVIVQPTAELRAGMLARAGWYELALGLALTALLIAYLVGSRNRADRLQILAANLQQEVIERERAEEMIIHSARHDFLTDLPNRMMFRERLKQEIGRVKRGDNSFAVLFLDLDQFKDINDTLGHQMGDQLLVAVAERLKQGLRQVDTVARLGGDEFAVIQTGLSDPADAAVLSTKLIDVLSSPFSVEGHEVHITASVGIAVCTPDVADEHAILTQADLAMYEAKNQGGRRYCFHLPEMDKEIRARAALVEDLRGGITRGELELYYQPQVNLDSGVIVGVEALVRWRHPTRGLLAPGKFIGEAERSGLILELDRFVLWEACRHGRAWLDAGVAPPVLAVNVSSSVLKRGAQYLESLDRALRETGYPPERLELELTETVFMETTHAHREILDALKQIGVRIALDDFGTGYSSLAYLRMFPIDRIKIAQVFVSRLPADANDAAIVEAITKLAAALRISLIAEGVETQEQLQFLRARGCVEAQGYYFSRPVPPEAATALIRRGAFEIALA
ncbi:MAG: EAL domain-containing protein [Alphaproteobacteria bacterium]